jgi:hypothetical protein
VKFAPKYFLVRLRRCWCCFIQSRPFRFFEGISFGRGITNTDNAMKRCLNIERNMKSKILIAGAFVTVFTMSTFAADALLSPRQMDNQPQVFVSSTATPSITVAYVTPSTALLSPRAKDNQSKSVAGIVNDSNPALACSKMMAGSPKAIGECASHTTMPGCMSVATK